MPLSPTLFGHALETTMKRICFIYTSRVRRAETARSLTTTVPFFWNAHVRHLFFNGKLRLHAKTDNRVAPPTQDVAVHFKLKILVSTRKRKVGELADFPSQKTCCGSLVRGPGNRAVWRCSDALSSVPPTLTQTHKFVESHAEALLSGVLHNI